MRSSQWLQDAKNQLSQLVDAALRGESQHITLSGKPAGVVLSEEAFESLQRSAQVAAPGFVAHVRAIPKQKEWEEEADVKRVSLALRDVDFS